MPSPGAMVQRNPLDLVFANQHFQRQQLQQVQGDMRDMKKLLHWIVEKERGQGNAPPLVDLPSSGSFVSSGRTFEARGQGPFTQEDIDQAKRRRMEEARHLARRSKNLASPEEGDSTPMIAHMRNTVAAQQGRASPGSEEDRQEKLRDVQQKLNSMLPRSSASMPNPNQSIEFALPSDRNDGYTGDPFVPNFDGYDYGNADEGQLRDPDSMMSIDFHKRPSVGQSFHQDAVFTPGGGNFDDPALSFGLAGQNQPESRAYDSMPVSFIKKDWNMDDKYIPNESSAKDPAHHESISGNPIPSLPAVTPAFLPDKDNDCTVM